MATFTLGFVRTSALQPQFTFIGASDPNGNVPRSGTVWTIEGPSVTFDNGGTPTTVQSSYFVYGTGFDVTPTNPLPTSGTITKILHVVPGDEAGPAPLDPAEIGVSYLVERVFAIIDGLNIAASAFAAAAFAGTVSDLLLAGDDVFLGQSADAGFLSILQPAFVRGGGGGDTIYGAGVQDTLWGETGDDLIVLAEDGFPIVNLSDGSTVDGGTGDDTLTGGKYTDFLAGGDGVDRLSGGRSNDTLNGGLDRDLMRGGGGDDWIIVASGEVEAGEIIDGGTGSDALFAFGSMPTPLDLTEALITGIERIEVNGALLLTRAQFAAFQRIDVSGLATVALADAGFTDLTGTAWYGYSAASRLTLLGSAGRDVINGRDTADIAPAITGYVSYAADDIIFGQGGNDVLNGGSGNDSLFGDAGNDLLRGDGGIDALTGGEGADTLDSGGNPTPPFSFQNDVLDGGTGNDTYVARHFNVTLVEGPGGGTDTLIVYNAWTLPAEVENLTIGTTTNLNGFGNALANRMTGNDATNTFSAFDGNDTLFGRGGTDVLNGGAGNDSLDGGADDDVLVGGPGLDRLIGGDGADSFTFNSEADSLPTTRDQILDFKQTVDRIVLNGFDANAILEGAQFFKFIGSGPFSVNSPGLLRVQSVDATSCLLFGNTDNDVAPEFSVYVRGAETLTESDFVL